MTGGVTELLRQRVRTDGAGRTPPDDGVITWTIDSVVEKCLVKHEGEAMLS